MHTYKGTLATTAGLTGGVILGKYQNKKTSGKVNCLDENLDENDFFKVASFVKHLGDGTSNIVSAYKVDNQECQEFGIHVAIRENKDFPSSPSDENDRRKEAIITKEMSDAKISPKLYRVIKKSGGKYTYIMEMMDGNLFDLFRKFPITRENLKKQVEAKLLELFQKMAKTGLYCIDLKLHNVVYKLGNGDGDVDIRLIDFDTEWCEKLEVIIMKNGYLLGKFRSRTDKEHVLANVMLLLFLVNSEYSRSFLGLNAPFMESYFAKLKADDIDAMGSLLKELEISDGNLLDPIIMMNHYSPGIGTKVKDFLNFIKRLKRSAFGNTQSPNRKKFPQGKILNPKSNRWVLRTGKIGRDLIDKRG